MVHHQTKATRVGKCPNVSHHPTNGRGYFISNRYLLWWCVSHIPKFRDINPYPWATNTISFGPTVAPIFRHLPGWPMLTRSTRSAATWHCTTIAESSPENIRDHGSDDVMVGPPFVIASLLQIAPLSLCFNNYRFTWPKQQLATGRGPHCSHVLFLV